MTRSVLRLSVDDRLLLQAALLQGGGALDAWRRWRSRATLDQIPSQLRGLQPLLHQNLSGLGVQDAEIRGLRQTRVSILYRNRLLLAEAASILRAFGEAGIATLLLKGAALVLTHYRDPGLRPMADLDLAVRLEDAPEAFQLLADLGWSSPRRPEPLALVESHSAPFGRGSTPPLDLHWRLLEECSWRGADDDFWAKAVPVEVEGAPSRVLDPTDQLVHVLVQGASWSMNAAVRWVADAQTILGSAGEELDWTRLLERAASHRQGLALAETLEFLRTVLDAPVPREVVQSLEAMPTSRLERLQYRARTRPPEKRGQLLALVLHIQRHRLVRDAGVSSGPRGFLQTVAREWGVPGVWRVVLEAVPRGVGRLWQGVTSWWRQ